MIDCKTCGNHGCRLCGTAARIASCKSHKQYAPKPITNADRIRAMSDEELAEIFANNDCGYCRIHDFCFDKGCARNCEDVWLDWLRQEVNTGKTD